MPRVIGSGSIIRRDRKKDGTLKSRQRCRIWDISVMLDDGSHPSRRVEGTESEAKAALVDYIAELSAAPAPCSSTFADYAWSWHDRRAASGIYANRTVDREVSRIVGLCLHLGDKRVDEIAPADIEDCYSALMHGDSPSGRCLAPSTIASYHTTLSAMFADAVRDGIVAEAPTRKAKRPTVPSTHGTAATTETVDVLLGRLDCSDGRQLAVLLCAICGLRRSEAMALTWDDYDGEHITVDKSADDDGSIKATKNGETRIVPVPASFRPLLDDARKSGRICDMQPHALSTWWRRNRRRFGMDGVRLHDLRHAYITRMAENNVNPKIAQTLAGHKTLAVTMQIYTHVQTEMLDAAVESAF